LTLREQDEWENYFEENKKVLSELNKKICSLESEIDKLVYELYGLTEEEINIVESA
jgi:hypothetical protein